MPFITKTFLLLFLALINSNLLEAQFYTEDFSNQSASENNWISGGTNAGNETWEWTNDIDNPVFDSQPGFGATTAANGFFQFDSDLNGANSHDVTLTGPAIDCSEESSVIVNFQNQYAFYGNAIAYLGVSTDDSIFNYYPILEDVVVQDLSDAVQNVVVDITADAAGQATVYLQFRWVGNFEYAWKIDDLQLSGNDLTPPHDLAINEFQGAPNFLQPISQPDSVRFQMLMSNNGSTNQTNVEAKGEILFNGNSIFTTTKMLDEIPVGTTDSLIVFTDNFIPESEGSYTIRYSVTQDSIDSISADNVKSIGFTVGQGVFSKDNGDTQLSIAPPNNTQIWETGNFYYVSNEAIATNAIWSVDANEPLNGKSVTIKLYKVNNTFQNSFTDDDLTLVGLGEHVFGEQVNFDAITTPLQSLISETAGVPLDANNDYLLTIAYEPEMSAPYSIIDYPFQLATVVKTNQWFLAGFGSNKTVVARLVIDFSVPVNEIELTEDNSINVFPNPVNGLLNLSIGLKEVAKNGVIRIINATGQLVYKEVLGDVKVENVEIDMAELPAGVYWIYLGSDDGVRGREVLVF